MAAPPLVALAALAPLVLAVGQVPAAAAAVAGAAAAAVTPAPEEAPLAVASASLGASRYRSSRKCVAPERPARHLTEEPPGSGSL